MKKTQLIGLALASALVVAGCGVTPGARTAPTGTAKTRFAPSDFTAAGVSKRQVVVKLAGRTLPQSLLRQTKGGPLVTGKIDSLRTLVVDLPPSGDMAAALRELRADKAVAYAEPVNMVQLERNVNDPKLGEQYSLKVTNAAEGWDKQMGDAKVIVAIIDSGIDMEHPDLKAKLSPDSYNVLDKNGNVQDDHGHGTHCAGIAAAIADNGVGTAGVAPGVTVMSVKVLDAGGRGSDASIAEGVVWAANHGAKVMSMSLGLYKRSKVLEDALQYALDKDVLITASAGNNNAENDPVAKPHLPSTHPGVVEVAATDSADKKARFSNFGKTVSVAAPGVDILSTVPRGAWKTMSGTSMAAPFVAGLAGLVRSQYPELTQAQVKAKIEAGAVDLGDKGFDPVFGHGRVSVPGALR